MSSTETLRHPLAPRFNNQRDPFEKNRFNSTENTGYHYCAEIGKWCEQAVWQILSGKLDKETYDPFNDFQLPYNHLKKGFSTLRFHDKHPTITHESLVPHYIDMLNNPDARDTLLVLAVHINNIFPKFNIPEQLADKILNHYNLGTPELIDSNARYLVDAILTLARLIYTKDQLLESLPGKLIPDVSLGYRNNGGSQSVQFDGIFVPKNQPIPIFDSSTDKEEFFFLSSKKPKGHNTLPPICWQDYTFLEVKTVFRARHVSGKSPISGISNYHFREFLDRLGRSCCEAGLAFAPKRVTFLYLNGVQPNAVFHKNLDTVFYSDWARYLEDCLTSDRTQSMDESGNYPQEYAKHLENLGMLLDFTTLVSERFGREKKKKTKTGFILNKAGQKKLNGFEKTNQELKLSTTKISETTKNPRKRKTHSPKIPQDNLF